VQVIQFLLSKCKYRYYLSILSFFNHHFETVAIAYATHASEWFCPFAAVVPLQQEPSRLNFKKLVTDSALSFINVSLAIIFTVQLNVN
jgi:hypothetical protein